MNPDLDEISIDKLTAEIRRRAELYKKGKCTYCQHILIKDADGQSKCPQCKFGYTYYNLFYPGCIEVLKVI